MKKSVQIFGLAALGLGMMISTSKATTALELGTVVAGSPADPTAETDRLIFLVASYNAGDTGVVSDPSDTGHTYTLAPAAGIPAAPLPDVGTNIGQNTGGGGVQTGLSIDLGTGGYDYVMVKWGDSSEYYYIGGDTGTITVNNDVNGNGESHYDLFTSDTASVPDNGSTVALLGLALVGIVAVSRMFRPATVRA